MTQLPERLEALAQLARNAELPASAERILSAALSRPSVARPLRDRLLVQAAALLRELDDDGLWPVAERVTECIRLVEARRAPRWRARGIPADAHPAETLLYEALLLGLELPTSPRTVWNLLAADLSTNTG